MRYALLGILILSAVGCRSATCADGSSSSGSTYNAYGGKLALSDSQTTYRSCGFGCCVPDKKGRIKACRCSPNCPCWRRDDHAGARR